MAQVRDKFRQRLHEHRIAARATEENRDAIKCMANGLIEIHKYLVQHATDKTPMSYDMLYGLFGSIDIDKARRATNYALQGIWQPRPAQEERKMVGEANVQESPSST